MTHRPTLSTNRCGQTLLSAALSLLAIHCTNSAGSAALSSAAPSSTTPGSASLAPAISSPPRAQAPAPSAPPPSARPPQPATTAPAEPRVYAKTRFVWVRPEPNSRAGWVGYLWLGGSAKLKTGQPVHGPGCLRWYEIEPHGFVCVDNQRATLNAADPTLLATLPYAPQTSSPWPHAYGESRGLQKYKKIPTRKVQRRREWDLPQHEAAVQAARAGGALARSLQGVDLSPARNPAPNLSNYPASLNEPRSRLLPLSTVAYSTEAYQQQQSWLLSADFMWLPKTRVVPYPKVLFQGLELGRQARLPVAFFRGKDRPAYRQQGTAMVAIPGHFKRLSWVELSGQEQQLGQVRYLQTRQGELWLRASEAVLPKPRSTPPWARTKAPRGRQTWVEVNVWQGWLIAYEGTRPVYVTLVSPGRGGTPVPGKPAIDTAATPTGRFAITGKFATATMVAPHDFVHSEVPWTQNFSGPHALHGAYWHDNWGERMSAGCINLSPRDGKWLFEFTEPQLPDGWHGLRWRPRVEPATTLIVR